MRLTAIALPRNAPCLRNASIAYAEQLGEKRQLAPNSGEMAKR
jgi:hypothetical protein